MSFWFSCFTFWVILLSLPLLFSTGLFSSVQFSCLVMFNSLQPHGLQHTRPPGPSLTPGTYSNSCPSTWWCHPTISSSVIPFSSIIIISSVQFSRPVVSDSLRPHELQHARPPCPSPTPRFYSNSSPLSRWCHPTISSSVGLLSHLQSLPASGSFPRSQFFISGGQSIGVSASTWVLLNIQDWFPLGLTGWISLLSKELSRVFSNTTVQKHQSFGTRLFL